MLLWMTAGLAAPLVTLPGSDQQIVLEGAADAAVEDAMSQLAARKFDEAAIAFGALADAGGNADARYLEAVAWYEGGSLNRTDRAVRDGLQSSPEHGPLLSLYGLVLADLGRGAEADKVLARAERIATAQSDAQLLERIRINRRLLGMDRGEVSMEAGDDSLGDLAEELRRGDLVAARKHIPVPATGDRRAELHAMLGRAAVARAEGRLDEAAAQLDKALTMARKGGLVRERAAALGEIGAVYALAGHQKLALAQLLEAIGLVSGTSFKVNEVAFRTEAGRVAVRLGDLTQARTQLSGARAVVPKGTRFPGGARIDELEGMIEARAGNVAKAEAAFASAHVDLVSRGYWADAARVCSAAVELHASAGDDKAIKKWSVLAKDLFSKAGDPVGPAHVLLSLGLGRVRAGDVEGAMEAFAEAAKSAERTGTPRGTSVAAVAKTNAAQALLVLGHSPKAGDFGLEGAVERHKKFQDAQASYARGLALYDAGKFADARAPFADARKGFDDLEEGAYGLAARRALAWAMYNDLQSKEPAVALPFWGELEQEGVQTFDVELELRARVAHAMALAKLGRGGDAQSFRAAAEEAEALGLNEVAAQCWAEVAERDEGVVQRARAARHAFALSDSQTSVYALYSVSIDAFNEEQYALALSLAEEALPKAGTLEESLQQVVDNAKSSME